MTVDAYSTALEIAAAIKNKDISATEITQTYIDRIEQYDTEINAVVVRRFEAALKEAAEADARVQSGEALGPLHGVPMTIKESYVLADTPSTWGIEAFADNMSSEDGLAVARFKAAGATFLGKTNVPTDLADYQSYNPIYGTTGNPWDTSRTPGGSSGGSSASLAAGFAALEAGSDIGGSIRNPAHFCGVYGHKPTYGIVPMQGHALVPNIPDADLAVCGPLARSAGDLSVALDIMAGPAPREATGWRLELPAGDISDLSKLRVAVWHTEAIAPVDTETRDRVQQVADTFARLGAKVDDQARPDFDFTAAHANYQTLLTAVMSAALKGDLLAAAEERAARYTAGDQSAEAVSARAAVISHRDWIRTNTKREKLRLAWQQFFEDYDLLICPQMATPAFPHDQSEPLAMREIQVDGVAQAYFQQSFWSGIVVNSYLPSTVFPTGLSKSGLPIGLQAVSAPYRDHRCIQTAGLITEHLGGFEAPPHLL